MVIDKDEVADLQARPGQVQTWDGTSPDRTSEKCKSL